jgi:hypothetical protein
VERSADDVELVLGLLSGGLYILPRNLTVQKQIGANVFTGSYVGQLGRHLRYAPNINLPWWAGVRTCTASTNTAETGKRALQEGRARRVLGDN